MENNHHNIIELLDNIHTRLSQATDLIDGVVLNSMDGITIGSLEILKRDLIQIISDIELTLDENHIK